MEQNFSSGNLDEMLKKAAKEPDLLKKMSSKSPEEILQTLPPDQAEKLKALMQNEELKQKLMKSPQAQMLIKMFMKGKGGA